MLCRLSIRDFVIVDHLELEFQAGFGALTGETGAGKSILLDALGLALGDRADAGAVRGGRERAEVCAEFDLPADGALAAWLAERALGAEEGGVMLRRVIDAGGRSRAWINGTPAPLAQLREAGEFLCDIHGQHAHHALLRADAQRALLDTYARATDLAAVTAAAHGAWRQALERRQHAERNSAATERERELLAWQVRELEELAFEPEEWAELNQEHGRLAHAVSLMSHADEVLAALGDNDQSVAPLLARLSARAGEMAGIDGALDETRALLADAAIQADEALHALRRYRDRLEPDPERLAGIEARIGAVTDLARKHRAVPEELPALLSDCRARLEALSASADPLRLVEQEAQTRAAFEEAAKRLSAARQPAAEALSAAVTAAMQNLAMAGGRFEIALEPLAEGSAHGLENVEFRVAPTATQPLRALARVASGGELSRIGLAIQVTASRDSATHTMIFDEVDAGIGGSVAEIVGQLLHRLGRERQVLCVTHLPQVAARADWQWNITKAERDGEIRSSVALLDDAGRVEEIARMLGGVRITDTTRRHAAEMLGQG